MAESPLERVRRLCASLPATSEKTAWGAPTFRVGTGRKARMFAMFADNHHGDGRVALWCHAPRGKQEVLTSAQPERYFKPPYVGPSGWIGVLLARVDDRELLEHLREACQEAAPEQPERPERERKLARGASPARGKKQGRARGR